VQQSRIRQRASVTLRRLRGAPASRRLARASAAANSWPGSTDSSGESSGSGAGGSSIAWRAPSEAATAFLDYLTTPDAAEIWAARGGFSSPNKNVDDSVYPDDIARANATGLANAEEFRFDMSDLQPSAFGGTPGAGLFKAFTDFVAKPDDVDGVTQQMETDAKKAFNS